MQTPWSHKVITAYYTGMMSEQVGINSYIKLTSMHFNLLINVNKCLIYVCLYLFSLLKVLKCILKGGSLKNRGMFNGSSNHLWQKWLFKEPCFGRCFGAPKELFYGITLNSWHRCFSDCSLITHIWDTLPDGWVPSRILPCVSICPFGYHTAWNNPKCSQIPKWGCPNVILESLFQLHLL